MQGVKDWHMVMIVALITGVGVLLLTVMTVAFRANPALLPSDEYGSGKDVSMANGKRFVTLMWHRREILSPFKRP